MQKEYNWKSEEAVSTVVSAILLLALVVAVITSINMRYVPQWTENAEHLHMRSATKDMSQLKSGVDLMLTASAAGKEPFSAGMPVTMGGGEIPLFNPSSSSSTLFLNTRAVNMYLTTEVGGVIWESDDLMEHMGCVDLLSNNDHYPNQRLSYECGGLAIGQKERSVMKMVPHISVGKSVNDTIDVNIDAIKLSGSQRTISSNSVEEVYFTYSGSGSIYDGSALVDELTLVLETENSMAWQDHLSRLMHASQISAGQYSINSNSTAIILYISGDNGANIRPRVHVHVFNVSLNVL